MKLSNTIKIQCGYIILILTPFLLLLLLSIITQQNAFIYIPGTSDEMDYWRCVLGFLEHGWNTGYYGINELHSNIGSFSTHGLFPNLFYLPFALLFGWDYNAIIIANSTFVSICFLILIYILRPNLSHSLCISGIYFLYIPIILWAPTSMTEIINYGFVTLFFTFFYKFYSANSDEKSISDKKRKLYLILTIIVGTISSVYRLIYIGLFLLPLLVWCQFKFSKKLVILFIAWILYSLLIYFLSALFMSPYPFGRFYEIFHSGDLGIAIGIIFNNIVNNIKGFFSFSTINTSIAEILQRYLYFSTLLIYLFLTLFKVEFTRTNDSWVSITFRRENFEKMYFLQFILLLFPFVVNIILYDVCRFRDFRTLAPFLWASFLITILYNRKKIMRVLAILILIFFILNMPFFGPTYREQVMGHTSNLNCNQDIDQITHIVVYNPNAIDPYENTLLSDTFDFCLYAYLDPGIGIEYVSNFDFNTAKSKYILIHTYQNIEGYEFVLMTSYGYLYVRN